MCGPCSAGILAHSYHTANCHILSVLSLNKPHNHTKVNKFHTFVERQIYKQILVTTTFEVIPKPKPARENGYTRASLSFCGPLAGAPPSPRFHLSWCCLSGAAAGTRPGSGVTSQATGKVQWLALLWEQWPSRLFLWLKGRCVRPRLNKNWTQGKREQSDIFFLFYFSFFTFPPLVQTVWVLTWWRSAAGMS